MRSFRWKIASVLLWLSWRKQSSRAQAPIAAQWSNKRIGPDGPWPVIEVTMGTGLNIGLYPAGQSDRSYFITMSYCGNMPGPCYADEAGLYNRSFSTGARDTFGEVSSSPSFTSGYQFGPSADWPSYFDNLELGPGSGVVIENLWMALIDQGTVQYPSGAGYALFAGCLNLGIPGNFYRNYTSGNSSYIASGLFQDSLTPSDSFGMHLGSAVTGPPPSLYFGGYDRTRVYGETYSAPGPIGPVPLLDIRIDVVAGYSPFEFETSRTGLLAAGNATIGTSLTVAVDGCAPYISLPRSSCDAIAASLPVQYREDLGLYLWDQDSPAYANIINSASALSFVFRSSNGQNITISVPFKHLNLTLEAPLAPAPVPYFPCNPKGDSRYVLGRAFLQDAFIAEDFWYQQQSVPYGMFYMAQAPGPNIGDSNIVALQSGGLGYSAISSDWASSWDGYWTPLTAEQAYNYTNGASGPDTAASAGTGALAPGAIAGIAVSAVAGVLIAAAAVTAWMFKKKGRALVLGGIPILRGRDGEGGAEHQHNQVWYPGGGPPKSPSQPPEAQTETGRGPVTELEQPRPELSVDGSSDVYHELDTGQHYQQLSQHSLAQVEHGGGATGHAGW